ncbi:MAG: MBL fold metallo-hydrolase [Desulfobacterales bacterium]
MQVTFWGVRGSIPTPGYDTARYGGNTLCIEAVPEGGNRTLIIDAGSGIRLLGNHLMSRLRPAAGATPIDLLLTHTHLDHILGLPFFRPIYHPAARVTLYGPVISAEDSLERVIGGQLSYRYFPVRQVELSAEVRYVDLREGTLELGDGIRVSTSYLNHPLLCMGYRIERGGKVICTAFDTEPFHNLFATDPADPGYDELMAQEGEHAAREADARLTAFFRGADLLIHDGQFTEAEYRCGRAGWGHSSIEHAVAVAEACGARRLALVHHDPLRTDDELDALAHTYGGLRPHSGLEVIFAHEGLSVPV